MRCIDLLLVLAENSDAAPGIGPAGKAMWMVLLVILGCGALGGFAGFMLTPPTDLELQKNPKPWWIARAIVLGIVAAGMVPLFLQVFGAVVSAGSKDGNTTTLMSTILSGGVVPEWLVFAGFCLVAAVSSQRFVSSLSDAVLRNLQQDIADAKRTAEDAKDTADDAEQDVNDLAGGTPTFAAAIAPALTDEQRRLLERMSQMKAKTDMRRFSPELLASETGMDVAKVRGLLVELEQMGHVQRRNDAPDRSERWRIRSRGIGAAKN